MTPDLHPDELTALRAYAQGRRANLTATRLGEARCTLAAAGYVRDCTHAESPMYVTATDAGREVLALPADLTYLSLFSGIGGLDLGLDRAGWTCVGQVELDAWCRTVLDRHWPEVPKHDDVRTAPDWWADRPRPAVRLVAGGFPCQPFSTAGLRGGTGDPRWGWPWFRSVIRAVRPEYVLLENVAALLDDTNAFGWVLGDLAEDGFDADWTVLSACAVGAPHVRERLFLVAYPTGNDGPARVGPGNGWPLEGLDGRPGSWVDPIDGLLEAERRSRRVAYGIPDELEPARVRALGNAVVPQVGELVGRLIREHAERVPA